MDDPIPHSPSIYLVYGFRWSRSRTHNAAGIRAYVVLKDLDNAASEYLQAPGTSREIISSFASIDPDVHVNLPHLSLIEQYDPADTSETAVSQPYAYVAAIARRMGDRDPLTGRGIIGLSVDDDLLAAGPGVTAEGRATLARLRDALAPDTKIGWFIVYNGDVDRWYPGMELANGNGEGKVEELDNASVAETVTTAMTGGAPGHTVIGDTASIGTATPTASATSLADNASPVRWLSYQ